MVASPSIIQLWTGITAANSPPSLASDGFRMPKYWDDVLVSVISSAGTTPTVTAKFWGFQGGDVDQWLPVGIDPTGAGDGTLAGVMNEGFAIGAFASGGSVIRHVEALTGLSNFDRVYLELTALTGAPTLDAYMRRRREQ